KAFAIMILIIPAAITLAALLEMFEGRGSSANNAASMRAKYEIQRLEFHKAARDGDLAKIKALLKDNPDLVFSKAARDESSRDWDSHEVSTALYVAAETSNKELAALL